MSAHKRIPVKLTAREWALVREAVYEWGSLCENDSEYNDGTFEKKMKARGEKMMDIALKIHMAMRKK